MPSWSDDEGRCHFDVDGVPCYQSGTGCPAHSVKQKKTRKKPNTSEIDRLKKKLAIAIERFEYLERVWDDGDAREWATDVLKELSDIDKE